MGAATSLRRRPAKPSFRYGIAEIEDGLLAGQCGYTKALPEITRVCGLLCGKPTHIYRKPDFSGGNAMGNKIIGLVLQLVLYNN